jgi:hypothetical protein
VAAGNQVRSLVMLCAESNGGAELRGKSAARDVNGFSIDQLFLSRPGGLRKYHRDLPVNK